MSSYFYYLLITQLSNRAKTKNKRYSISFDDYKYIGERDKWRDRVDMISDIAKELGKKVELRCE